MTRNSDSHPPQRRYIVSGRVQRVGFRYATYREANVLNLKGYVRNLADGRVEICAAGSEEKLDRFRQWLHRGPMLARVAEVSESSCRESLGPGFRIR